MPLSAPLCLFGVLSSLFKRKGRLFSLESRADKSKLERGRTSKSERRVNALNAFSSRGSLEGYPGKQACSSTYQIVALEAVERTARRKGSGCSPVDENALESRSSLFPFSPFQSTPVLPPLAGGEQLHSRPSRLSHRTQQRNHDSVHAIYDPPLTLYRPQGMPTNASTTALPSSSSSWFASNTLSAASSKSSSASKYGTTGGRGERRRPRVGLGFFDDKGGEAEVLEDELDLLGLKSNEGWSISVSREAVKPKMRLKRVRRRCSCWRAGKLTGVSLRRILLLPSTSLRLQPV